VDDGIQEPVGCRTDDKKGSPARGVVNRAIATPAPQEIIEGNEKGVGIGIGGEYDIFLERRNPDYIHLLDPLQNTRKGQSRSGKLTPSRKNKRRNTGKEMYQDIGNCKMTDEHLKLTFPVNGRKNIPHANKLFL